MSAKLPLYEHILHFFMPTRCLSCDGYFTYATHEALCACCATRLYPIEGKRCELCGHPIDSLIKLEPDHPYGRCTSCERQPPHYTQAHALWRYEGAITEILPSIKYGKDDAKAHQLARYAAPALKAQLEDWRQRYGAITLIPMPMTRWALAKRGFNLPTRLAQQLQGPDSPMSIGQLTRRRQRRPQASLALDQRWQNVADAFVWADRAQPPAPSVCLVDDVMTTGATAQAAAQVLSAAGARHVLVLALARATEI